MLRRMADPAFKTRILAERSRIGRTATGAPLDALLWQVFPLGEVPNYEPDRDDSVAGRAAALGREPFELMYDMLLENDRATFRDPALPSTGIEWVLVRGVPVVESGRLRESALPGEAIRAPLRE